VKIALALLALLFIGVIGAHFLIADRGQVYVSFHGYTLQTSVPVLVLLLILSYGIVRLMARLVRLPANVGRAATQLRARRAREQLANGLLALDTGDWVRGERLLGRSAHDSDKPILHYLGAARAAQEQGATDRRDRWLELAREQKAEGEPAVLLTVAQMQLADGQHARALDTLRELDEVAGDYPRALALQAQASAALEDWSKVLAVVPRLRKLRALPADEIDALELRAQASALAGAAKGDAERIRSMWRGLGRDLAGRIELQRAYAKALMEAGDARGAEEVIRQALKTEWDTELVQRYGELDSGDPAKQLKRVEEWLPAHAEDATLLLAAARLSMRNELWGKARSYVETSLSLSPNVQAYQLYGKLLDQLGERERAAEAFRNGLALATGRGSGLLALPAPKA
jgi:HemY protein